MKNISAIRKNQEQWTDSYLKITKKIDDIEAILNSKHFELLYKNPTLKRKRLQEKLTYLKEQKIFYAKKSDECQKALLELLV